jgi:uncharacterized protein (DUF1015 family)
MAEIIPFRGVLYDPHKVGEISRVVAPPYDVIGPAEQKALYARHPQNIIRLELGEEHPDDSPEDNRYTRAQQRLVEWLGAGILQRDDQDSMYLYAIDYRVPSGEQRRMRGFLSLVTLEEFGTGRIFPHENTRAAAKSDRLQLMESCRSNFSPVFSLYSDPDDRIMQSFEKAVDEEKARFDLIDSDGSRHRFWSVTDAKILAEVAALMKPLPLFIADGHHRYESALRYRNAQRQAHGNPGGRLPSDYVMMYFCNLDGPGLTILPTHRLIPAPLPFTAMDVRRRLAENFNIQTFPFAKDTEQPTRQRFLAALHAAPAANAHTLGLILRGETRYNLLTLNPGAEAKLGDSARDRLDVAILQQLVLHDAMQLSPEDEERLMYLKDENDVINAITDGQAEAAILLNAPRITEVKDVARAGDRMPHKSTYFYPKPLTGLVLAVM